jgi:hypothetical protein
LIETLSKAFGHPVVIMNMPGADGRIGIAALAKSAADGYTILFSGGAISLIPALRKVVPFDPDKDIQPVAELLLDGAAEGERQHDAADRQHQDQPDDGGGDEAQRQGGGPAPGMARAHHACSCAASL